MGICAGFDYGTSNCAIGTCSDTGEVRLLPVEEDGSTLISSTLYAPKPDFELEPEEEVDELQSAASIASAQWSGTSSPSSEQSTTRSRAS